MMKTVPGEARYRVVGSLVIAQTISGAEYCYRYAPLPANTSPGQVDRLLASGQIELIEEDAT